VFGRSPDPIGRSPPPTRCLRLDRAQMYERRRRQDSTTGLGTSSSLAFPNVCQEKASYDSTPVCSADLTGPACSETGAHWSTTPSAGPRWGVGDGRLHGLSGGYTWVLLNRRLCPSATARRDVTDVVNSAGGKIPGHLKLPQHAGLLVLPSQAASRRRPSHRPRQYRQTTINSYKSFREFGIVQGAPEAAGLLGFATYVLAHAPVRRACADRVVLA